MGSIDSPMITMMAETRFFMPTEQMDTPWYSFDFGVTHFIIISTEHAFAPETPQHNFVVQVGSAVAGVNDNVTCSAGPGCR